VLMMWASKVSRSTMAAQSGGSVKVDVHSEKARYPDPASASSELWSCRMRTTRPERSARSAADERGFTQRADA